MHAVALRRGLQGGAARHAVAWRAIAPMQPAHAPVHVPPTGGSIISSCAPRRIKNALASCAGVLPGSVPLNPIKEMLPSTHSGMKFAPQPTNVHVTGFIKAAERRGYQVG